MNELAQRTNVYKQIDPILILEDTKENQDLLKGLLKRMKIPCLIAENGKEGLDLMESNQFSIFLVDLMMPVMDGKNFIRNLKEKKPEALILVQTALDSSETIIDIMKLGVFDYVIKPIDPEIFSKTITKCLEFMYLKDMERNISKNAGLKIRSQIEWLNYKESRRIADKDLAEIKSIYNLKTSISQGAGFGTLVSLIDIIKSTMKENENYYKIDKQLIDLLIDNNDSCRNMMDGLNTISNILNKEIELEESDAATLVRSIPGMIANVIPLLSNKDLSITYPELKMNCKLNLNLEKLDMAIEELIINAYKYSIPGSTINIFSYISEGYFWLSTLNTVSKDPYGGIPKKFEKLVIEPFFRILPPDESVSKIERFGLGLGLTVVDDIIRKHKGIFVIHDVLNQTHDQEKTSVIAEIMLPVKTE
ncbi:MAG: response regulator [Spirochaetota bacterium]|nr:response regulator [Spirochaetota bacterium]